MYVHMSYKPNVTNDIQDDWQNNQTQLQILKPKVKYIGNE